MPIKESKLYLLEEGPTFDMSPFKCKELYEEFLKNYLIEDSAFFNDTVIKTALPKIKGIQVNKFESGLDEVVFIEGILYLPEMFFKRRIEKASDIRQMLNDFPVLEEALETAILYVYSYCNHDDLRARNLVASFYSKRKNRLKGQIIAEKTFCTIGEINPLTSNVLSQLSKILGLDIIKETLLMGPTYLEKEIDIRTSKRGLGRKIVDLILNIDELSKEEEYYRTSEEINEGLKDKFLKPLFKNLKGYSQEMQKKIISLLETSNFNTIQIRLLVDSNSAGLSESEKNKLTEYIEIFNQHYFELTPFFITEFPRVPTKIDILGNRRCNVEDLTAVNKILTVMNKIEFSKNSVRTRLLKQWKKLQELIILSLTKKVADRGLLDETFNLGEVIDLSFYQSQTDEFDLAISDKVLKLDNKIKKNNG